MKQRQVFINFVIIITLVSIALGVSLAGLAGLAQAAPVHGLEWRLEALAPANTPLLQSGIPTLTVTKSSVNEGDNLLRPGERITYTITVSNSSDISATNVVISDTLPANTAFVANSIQITPTQAGVSGSLPTLATITVTEQSRVTVTYAVTVNPSVANGTTIVNTASVTSNEVITPVTGSVTDTVVNQADLTISKSNGVNSLVPGTVTTYTIIVTNNGPSAVTGATVTDSFPLQGDTTWTCSGSGGGNCSTSSGMGSLTNHLIDLPVGAWVTYVASGTVSASVTGQLTNTASVTVPVGVADPVPGNNRASDTDTLTPQADLSISKSNGVSSLVPGTVTTYTIVVSNAGPSSANGTSISDTFPAALTGATWSRTGSGGDCPTTPTSGNINCTINLAPGGIVTFTASGTVNPGARGTLTNTAKLTPPSGVTDTSSGNDNATDTDPLLPQADVGVTKSGPSQVIAGDPLTYDVTVTNYGPSNATDVVFFDQLPTGVFFQSVTSSSPACSEVQNVVTCNLGTIVKSGTVTITIQVLVDPARVAPFSNMAQVSNNAETDPTPSNNSSLPVITSVQVRTDLAISKTAAPPSAALGVPITYTLRITNNGPSNATEVAVTDPLPSGANGVTFVSASSTLGTCSGTTTVNCALGNMVSGGVATVTIVVNPKATGTVTNTATVTSTTTDPTSGNNSASVSTTVNRITDLAIAATDLPDPVTQGSNLTYNLTVTNNGPSNATSVSATHTLPAGVTFQSVTPGSPTCNHAGGVVSCSLGGMAKGSSSPISVVVKVNSTTSGNISGTATVTVAGSTDPNMSNNSAVATTLVNKLDRVYLPFIIKPAPTVLSVWNDKTGGIITFSVIEAGVSCTVPNNQTSPCGSFPPGTYTVKVTSICGNATTSKSYSSGPQTTRVFCK